MDRNCRVQLKVAIDTLGMSREVQVRKYLGEGADGQLAGVSVRQ